MINTVNYITPYQQWQKDKHGNYIGEEPCQEYENGTAADDEAARWIEREAEFLLTDQ